LMIDVFSLVALVFVLVWVKRRRRFFHSRIVSPFCCVGFESEGNRVKNILISVEYSKYVKCMCL
jgi:hypothetical protein